MNDALYVFDREHEGRRVVVALDLTDRSQPLTLEGPTMLSTTSSHPGPPTPLAPNEGRIVALDDISGTQIPTASA